MAWCWLSLAIVRICALIPGGGGGRMRYNPFGHERSILSLWGVLHLGWRVRLLPPFPVTPEKVRLALGCVPPGVIYTAGNLKGACIFCLCSLGYTWLVIVRIIPPLSTPTPLNAPFSRQIQELANLPVQTPSPEAGVDATGQRGRPNWYLPWWY